MARVSCASDSGITLLELVVSTAVLSVLMVAMGGIVTNVFRAWAVEDSFSAMNAQMRNAAASIIDEITPAAIADINSVTPAVKGIEISNSPIASITFQKPVGTSGLQWSLPITLSLRNEDSNANLRLDPGEDVNGNGALDRVIERAQDLDESGSIDVEEVRVIARDIDGLTFTLSGDVLTVTLTGRRPALGHTGSTMQSTVSLRARIVN